MTQSIQERVQAGASLTLALPLSDKAVTATVIAAERFGVEPWELAVHVLAFKQSLSLRKELIQRRREEK